MTRDNLHNKQSDSPQEKYLLEQIKISLENIYSNEADTVKLSGLFNILFTCGPLPQKLFDKNFLPNLVGYLMPHIFITQYSRRELLLSAGHIPQYLYYCNRGFARGFFVDSKTSKEITHFFWSPPAIVTIPYSFFNQHPSQHFIEVIAGTELLSISFLDLQDAIKRYPVIEIFSRNVILTYHEYERNRNYALSFYSPWQRYINLLKTHPDIEQLVSKEVIASYLNITPQSLSRMLKKNRHP